MAIARLHLKYVRDNFLEIYDTKNDIIDGISAVRFHIYLFVCEIQQSFIVIQNRNSVSNDNRKEEKIFQQMILLKWMDWS